MRTLNTAGASAIIRDEAEAAPFKSRVLRMRIILFLAVAANSFDLVATSFGIHWFGNREGNPLLASLAHGQWLVFVAIKGMIVPLLIWALYRSRHHTPVLSAAGLAIVTLAMTVAVGQWVGWMAGVARVSALMGY
jgi:uncharacterized membrane protein